MRTVDSVHICLHRDTDARAHTLYTHMHACVVMALVPVRENTACTWSAGTISSLPCVLLQVAADACFPSFLLVNSSRYKKQKCL